VCALQKGMDKDDLIWLSSKGENFNIMASSCAEG
jgi:hypothetical protein